MSPCKALTFQRDSRDAHRMSCGKEQIVTYDTNSDLVHRISYGKEQIRRYLIQTACSQNIVRKGESLLMTQTLVHRISCGKEQIVPYDTNSCSQNIVRKGADRSL